METGDSRDSYSWRALVSSPALSIAFISLAAVALPAQDRPTPDEISSNHADALVVAKFKIYGKRATGRAAMTDRAAADAICAGLAWLARHQDADGKWSPGGFMVHDKNGEKCDGAGKPVHDTGVTGLALLAFLAEGNTTTEGSHASAVATAVGWIRGQQSKQGRFGAALNSAYLYDHAIATLAMVEAAGLSDDDDLRTSAKAGLDYLERHRKPNQCWNYDRGSILPDMSLSSWCMTAILVGGHFGFEVNPQTTKVCESFLDKLTDPETGHCGYTKRGQNSARFSTEHQVRFPPHKSAALTAGALFCRFLVGQQPRRVPVMEAAAKAILTRPPVWNDSGDIDMYYWFYGSQAMHQMGGRHWTKWRKQIVKALVPNQRKDGNFAGSWDNSGAWGTVGGRVYSTAMSALALQAEYRLDAAAFDGVPVPETGRFSRVHAAWVAGEFARVNRELRTLTSEKIIATQTVFEAAATRHLQRAFQAEMKTRSEAVEGHRKPTDYLAARESLRSIGKRYAGLPPAKRAAEVLKTFRNDLEIRREIQASEALAKFKDRPSRTRILRLRRFIMNYDGTLAAKRAAQRLKSKRR